MNGPGYMWSMTPPPALPPRVCGWRVWQASEAAAVFTFIGFYPIVKPVFDRAKLGLLWKAILFNSLILLMYGLLIYLMGMDQLAEEFREMGQMMTIVTLILGNAVFFLLDKVLLRFHKIK